RHDDWTSARGRRGHDHAGIRNGPWLLVCGPWLKNSRNQKPGTRDQRPASYGDSMYENFKRILVTTDFSESGDHAIGHAFRMAADHGAEVVMLHVLELVVAPNPLYAHYYPTDLLTPEIRERAENDARQGLLERVPKTGPLAGVSHQTILTHGSPAEEI